MTKAAGSAGKGNDVPQPTVVGDKRKRGQNGGGRPPVDPKTRAKIRASARKPGATRNGVAREHGVSGDTVTRICAAARPPITFDRKGTQAATEARQTDLKARRVAFTSRLMDDVEEFHRLLFQERTARTTDGNGGVVEYQLEPSARDWKDTMTAIGIGIDKIIVLERHDADERDLPAVEQWLAAMGLGRAS